MRDTALYIAQGSRRSGRCGRCGQAVMWGTLATRRAKNAPPLVATPHVLRVEQRANGVAVEVLAFDQVHRCPAGTRPAARRAANRTAPRPVPKPVPADHVYASFPPARVAELRRQIETSAPPKPPAPPLEKRW
jgi:hypothetical protein